VGWGETYNVGWRLTPAGCTPVNDVVVRSEASVPKFGQGVTAGIPVNASQGSTSFQMPCNGGSAGDYGYTFNLNFSSLGAAYGKPYDCALNKTYRVVGGGCSGGNYVQPSLPSCSSGGGDGDGSISGPSCPTDSTGTYPGCSCSLAGYEYNQETNTCDVGFCTHVYTSIRDVESGYEGVMRANSTSIMSWDLRPAGCDPSKEYSQITIDVEGSETLRYSAPGSEGSLTFKTPGCKWNEDRTDAYIRVSSPTFGPGFTEVYTHGHDLLCDGESFDYTLRYTGIQDCHYSWCPPGVQTGDPFTADVVVGNGWNKFGNKWLLEDVKSMTVRSGSWSATVNPQLGGTASSYPPNGFFKTDSSGVLIDVPRGGSLDSNNGWSFYFKEVGQTDSDGRLIQYWNIKDGYPFIRVCSSVSYCDPTKAIGRYGSFTISRWSILPRSP